MHDIARMRHAIAEASQIVLDGFELDTDVEGRRHPNRNMDPRGAVMWNRVIEANPPATAKQRTQLPRSRCRQSTKIGPKRGCCRTETRIRQVSSISLILRSAGTRVSYPVWCARLRFSPQAVIRKGRRISSIKGKFIAGPIDFSWLSQARKLGVTALWVGLGLWFLKGLRKSDSFFVSNLIMREGGVQPDAKRWVLNKLEKAGLITIERRGKRSPRVTLVV